MSCAILLAVVLTATGSGADPVAPGLELDLAPAPLALAPLQLAPPFEDAAPATALLAGVDVEPASGEDVGAARVAHLRRWERALKWSTAGALVVTATLGTLVAINQPTALGDGRCFTGQSPIFGDYGCDRGLSTLHGMAGVASVLLYTANGALALAIPGPVGKVSPGARPWHRALTWIHLVGIYLQPVLGLVAAFPQVIGMHNTAATDAFPRDLRTAHLSLGYLTVAAYVATLALEGG